MKQTPDAELRIVDIVNFKSEAFKQAGQEFGINAIPYVRIHAKDGSLVQEEKNGSMAVISSAVSKAAGR